MMDLLRALHTVYPEHKLWTIETDFLLRPSPPLHQQHFIAFTGRDSAAKLRLQDTRQRPQRKPLSLYTGRLPCALQSLRLASRTVLPPVNVQLIAAIKAHAHTDTHKTDTHVWTWHTMWSVHFFSFFMHLNMFPNNTKNRQLLHYVM